MSIKERAKVLPTNPAYLKNMVNVDTDFWGQHKESAGEKVQHLAAFIGRAVLT